MFLRHLYAQVPQVVFDVVLKLVLVFNRFAFEGVTGVGLFVWLLQDQVVLGLHKGVFFVLFHSVDFLGSFLVDHILNDQNRLFFEIQGALGFQGLFGRDSLLFECTQ